MFVFTVRCFYLATLSVAGNLEVADYNTGSDEELVETAVVAAAGNMRLAKNSALWLRSQQPMRASTGDAYCIPVVRGVVIYSLYRLKNPNMK